MDKYEDFEKTLDPHRAEERAAAPVWTSNLTLS